MCAAVIIAFDPICAFTGAKEFPCSRTFFPKRNGCSLCTRCFGPTWPSPGLSIVRISFVHGIVSNTAPVRDTVHTSIGQSPSAIQSGDSVSVLSCFPCAQYFVQRQGYENNFLLALLAVKIELVVSVIDQQQHRCEQLQLVAQTDCSICIVSCAISL